MLNTADDPVDFLKNEAAHAGEDAAYVYLQEMKTLDAGLPISVVKIHYIKMRARRAWRFAQAALDLQRATRHRNIHGRPYSDQDLIDSGQDWGALSTCEPCDECGARIPPHVKPVSISDYWHYPECSLHPKNSV